MLFKRLSVAWWMTLLAPGTWAISGLGRDSEGNYPPARSLAEAPLISGRQAARAAAAALAAASPECPADQYERAEAKAFEQLGFSLRNPPEALIEERAAALAAEAAAATSSSSAGVRNGSAIYAGQLLGAAVAALVHPGACCNPSALNAYEAVRDTSPDSSHLASQRPKQNTTRYLPFPYFYFISFVAQSPAGVHLTIGGARSH